jgi:hypothetical protein
MSGSDLTPATGSDQKHHITAKQREGLLQNLTEEQVNAWDKRYGDQIRDTDKLDYDLKTKNINITRQEQVQQPAVARQEEQAASKAPAEKSHLTAEQADVMVNKAGMSRQDAEQFAVQHNFKDTDKVWLDDKGALHREDLAHQKAREQLAQEKVDKAKLVEETKGLGLSHDQIDGMSARELRELQAMAAEATERSHRQAELAKKEAEYQSFHNKGTLTDKQLEALTKGAHLTPEAALKKGEELNLRPNDKIVVEGEKVIIKRRGEDQEPSAKAPEKSAAADHPLTKLFNRDEHPKFEMQHVETAMPQPGGKGGLAKGSTASLA